MLWHRRRNLPRAQNLVVVKSVGKSLGWHGVRLGYAAMNSRAADPSQLPFWNVNGLAAYILKTLSEFKDEFPAKPCSGRTRLPRRKLLTHI